MSRFQAIGKNLKKLDLFSSSTFLRYKADQQYATNTGLITSLVVIVILIALFASEGLKTVRKEIITSSFISQNDVDPSQLSITMSPEGGFMFMVGMPGFDLSNSSYQVFNFSLYQEYFNPVLKLVNRTRYTMVPCTAEHLAFNTEISAMYDKLNMSQMLCPPLGQSFVVQGKKTSESYARFRVGIQSCNNSLDSGCLSSSNFNTLATGETQFNIVFPFINTKINPGDSDYKSVFLEDRNMVSFSQKFGAQVYVGLQQDIVQTDVSLTPIQQTESQNVTTVPNLFQTYYYMNTAQTFSYMDLIFTKQPTTITYSRSFNKVDNYFSYVGGLIGIMIGLIFVMGFFTERSYQLSIGSRLFLHKDDQGIPSQSFHFGYYISSLIANVLNFLGCPPKWQKTQMFLSYCEQMQEQLDICYILRKLIFLEAVVSKLLEPHELEAIYLRKKMTLDKAKQIRRKHCLPELIKQIEQNDPDDRNDKKCLNQFSKQEIVFIHDETSDQNQRRRKSSYHSSAPVSQNSDKISVIEVDLEDDDNFDDLKNCIRKVQIQSGKGKQISQRILNQIDQDLIQRLQNRKINRDINSDVIKVRSLDSSSDNNQALASRPKGKRDKMNVEILEYNDDK